MLTSPNPTKFSVAVNSIVTVWSPSDEHGPVGVLGEVVTRPGVGQYPLRDGLAEVDAFRSAPTWTPAAV